MRFVLGEPPTAKNFSPEADGWIPLKEPRPWTLVMVGSALGIPLALLAGFAWTQLVDVGAMSFTFPRTGPAGKYLALVMLFCGPLIGFALLIALHEYCHAIACPRFGMTCDTVVGAWPSRMLFYAGHIREVTRTRYLVTCAMPFILLTLLPLSVGVAIGKMGAGWATLSVANALFCGGDAVIAFVICHQVPARATIQNKGWATWWQTTEPTARSNRKPAPQS